MFFGLMTGLSVGIFCSQKLDIVFHFLVNVRIGPGAMAKEMAEIGIESIARLSVFSMLSIVSSGKPRIIEVSVMMPVSLRSLSASIDPPRSGPF